MEGLIAVILVSPTEPTDLRELGVSSSTPENYGADILIPGDGFLVGIQRKVFPGDFLSSLTDGRLAEHLHALTKCDLAILILEGRPAWSTSGFLVGYDYGQGREFARSSLRSLLLSAQYLLGIAHHWTDNLPDTLDFIRDIARWAEKDEHDSLFKRPGIPKPEFKRRKIQPRDKAVYLLQGFDGIGYTTAGAIYDHFGHLPLNWTVPAKALAEVPGVGKGRVQKLTELIAAKESNV